MAEMGPALRREGQKKTGHEFDSLDCIRALAEQSQALKSSDCVLPAKGWLPYSAISVCTTSINQGTRR